MQDGRNDIPTLTPPNEPLTIEQLREMDGEPVWVETGNQFSDWGKVDFNRRRIWPFGTAGEWWDFRYYGDWVPYAYPPAHIDREAWTTKWEVDEFGHKCSKCGEYLPSGDDDIFPQFCPNCGRATTADALEELEKRLRG